jgi:Fic family protein
MVNVKALHLPAARSSTGDDTPSQPGLLKLSINCQLKAPFCKLNSAKWAKLTKTSDETARRDIKELVGSGVLVQEAGGGRNTSYALKK